MAEKKEKVRGVCAKRRLADVMNSEGSLVYHPSGVDLLMLHRNRSCLAFSRASGDRVRRASVR
jgi:hypothetical protein